jgi:hypothetical protein
LPHRPDQPGGKISGIHRRGVRQFLMPVVSISASMAMGAFAMLVIADSEQLLNLQWL